LTTAVGEILFLAHRLPYPPDRGDRIRSWHVLNALAKLAPVHVIAPVDRVADMIHVPVVERVAASVTTSVRPGSKALAVARALATGSSASVAAFAVPALKRQTERLVAKGEIDTIYAYSGQMAAYVPEGFAGRFVMDFVDMDSAKFAALPGLANAQEARRLKAFEIATSKRANVSLFVSRAEAELFRRETGQAAQILENGIDFDHFRPGCVPAIVDAPHPLIVFTGQMDYAPNVEAVLAFASNVLPHIPVATFAIVGRAPTAAVRALAGDRIIVTGEVPDTRPWLVAADVVVAPLKLARGVQNKILEAMAMGKPVVASFAAGVGIDAVDGRDLIVADDSAQPLAMLLRDPERMRRIGLSARARVVARYGWDAQMMPLAGYVGR
jgi:polysaccharide biosynthesis protein PslH